MNKEPLSAPIALVTGGSRGLGRSIALHLAARGADVILTYRERADEARAVVAEIEAKGRRAVAIPGDVRRSADLARAVSETLARWKRDRLDYLVNSAGVGGSAPFVETTEAQLDELIDVHFRGVFLLTQRLLPVLADGGSIVNVTTGLTRYTYPGQSAYASVKGAVEVLTRQLARELAPRGITVNAVAPGGIETDFGGGIMKNAEVQKAVIAATPLGRIGVPDDIGGLVAFLVSPEAHWLTGQRLEATGGFAL